ncbi:MAG: DUF3048 domain-containing protein [Lachnospiraceae bacterium]|nr:DUF3048 domain-containing protein [Lachnospiraceae bacterium]
MKKKIYGLSVLLATALLVGCSGIYTGTDSPVITEENEESPAPVLSVTDDVPVEDDSVPPHDGMVRSLLTNEWIDADAAQSRPIAVMIANEKDAVPHYNLSEASVVYEANVEGRMTRLMAIFEGWSDLDKIGNIRSLRSYYAYWAFEWDAFLVHVGGPFFIDELLAQPTTETIDMNSRTGENAFFRSDDRAMPHNVYTSGELLEDAIENNGYSTEYRGVTDDSHFLFAAKSEPNTLSQYGDSAVTAEYIDMSGCYPLTRCYFEYDDSDGLYYRSQHLSGDVDGPHIDAATGEQLSFKNIIIQYTQYEDLGLEEGYLAFQCHDDTMDGWYFTNGRGIHVTWKKYSDYGATRYYDDNGNEIVLNTGKTMICIIEDGDVFYYR